VKHAAFLLPVVLIAAGFAQTQEIAWSDQEKPIAEQIGKLRSLPDDVRGSAQRQLALQIRALPAVPNKLRLTMGLSGRATEGDFGRDTLQEVTTTLEDAIAELKPGEDGPYLELASLARYEHMNVTLDSAQYASALKRLEEEDRERNSVNFTLTDLNGKAWRLKDLKGKVVMLNFWATWCPPCRKEMPDLESL
jgi:hypothetical protein